MPDQPGPDQVLDRLIDTLCEPVSLSPAVAARIMDTIRVDATVSGAARALPVRRAPRYAGPWLAAAAALIVMVAGVAVWRAQLSDRVPSRMAVQFVLPGVDAKQVAVVGDFNGWDVRATPLSRPTSAEPWRVTIELSPGPHVYSFVVDGVRWMPDPATPRAADSDFGSPNSMLTVAPGAS